jgi:hypothetical protein
MNMTTNIVTLPVEIRKKLMLVRDTLRAKGRKPVQGLTKQDYFNSFDGVKAEVERVVSLAQPGWEQQAHRVLDIALEP